MHTSFCKLVSVWMHGNVNLSFITFVTNSMKKTWIKVTDLQMHTNLHNMFSVLKMALTRVPKPQSYFKDQIFVKHAQLTAFYIFCLEKLPMFGITKLYIFSSNFRAVCTNFILKFQSKSDTHLFDQSDILKIFWRFC